MLSNEDIFKVLQTKGNELSDWHKENFNPYTVIVITEDEVKIMESRQEFPILRGE